MKDCTTCKYGHEDERLGIPMCHHPKRFSEDCIDFNMHEEEEIKESEKPVPNDLEEAADEYEHNRVFESELENYSIYLDSLEDGEEPKMKEPSKDAQYLLNADVIDAFIAGAKWQKEQDDKELSDLLTIAHLQGAEQMKEQTLMGAVKWLVDDDYHETSEKGRFILGSVGIGYNGYYIPYSDLLKLPKEDKSGNKHYLFGKHLSEETRAKMSLAHKGHVVSEETRRKIGNANRKKNDSNQ